MKVEDKNRIADLNTINGNDSASLQNEINYWESIGWEVINLNKRRIFNPVNGKTTELNMCPVDLLVKKGEQRYLIEFKTRRNYNYDEVMKMGGLLLDNTKYNALVQFAEYYRCQKALYVNWWQYGADKPFNTYVDVLSAKVASKRDYLKRKTTDFNDYRIVTELGLFYKDDQVLAKRETYEWEEK